MLTVEKAEEAVAKNVGSLESLCKRAICTADTNLMIALFTTNLSTKELETLHMVEVIKRTSAALSKEITEQAAVLGIKNLTQHYEDCLKKGRSTIINTLVRKNHKLYFATRSNQHPAKLLECLESRRSDMCEGLYEVSIKCANEAKRIRRYKELANATARVREYVRKKMQPKGKQTNARP